MLTCIHVGIDVSAKWFDVFVSQTKDRSVTRYKNNPAGHDQFLQDVQGQAKKTFVCMEHTGGYETALALKCHGTKFIVSLVDGALISNYRKSFGAAKSKTDILDAQLLAKFVRERKPAQWIPLPDEYRNLKELVKFREDLIEMRTMNKNQAFKTLSSNFVTSQRATLLGVLNLQIEETEKQIRELIAASDVLKSEIKLLDSIPGIAIVSAARILAETGPISNYETAKDYALAAGLCPIAMQSGKRTPPGKLPVYGNKSLRSAFYFPAVVNRRHPTGINEFMKRIQSNGPKVKMTVIVAGMRKLAHIVYGVLKSKTPYNPLKVLRAS